MNTNKRKLYLASKSRQRINILRNLGVYFITLEPNIKEKRKGDPKQIAVLNARLKAWSVADKVEHGCIIAADTLVVFNNEIIGKPLNQEDARTIIRKLSGKWHRVITGMSVVLVPENMEFVDVVETKVKFKQLDEKEINFYVLTGEPLNKAGGYAIQGYASLFIEKIEGSFFNVVGLPIERLYLLLKKVGISLLEYISS